MAHIDIASLAGRSAVIAAHHANHAALVKRARELGWTDIVWEDPNPYCGGAAPYERFDSPPATGILMGKAPGARDWRDSKGRGGYAVSVIPPDLT